MSDLVDRIKKLSPVKQALLLRRLEGSSLATRGNHRKRLIAYIVAESRQIGVSAEEPTSAEYTRSLRAFTEDRLPGHMVPSRFVLIDALPQTASGKVDRQSLPQLDSTETSLEDSLVSPRDAVEESLAEIWASVLGVEAVGIHDDFFQLGGDSIVSIQIASRARQAGLSLTPAQLTQNPSIAALAAVLDTDEPVPSEQGRVSGSVPLSPIQHWFFEQQFEEPYHWNQWMILELRRPLDHSLLEQAAQQLGEHHDALRLRFARTPTGWNQFHADSVAEVPVTQVDLSAVAEEELESSLLLASEKMQIRLNLTEGPVIRLVCFEMGKERPPQLLILIHHLVVDSTSWHILLEDLNTACTQLDRGELVQLPPKTTSFKSWSEELSEHAQDAAFQREAAFWTEQADTRTPALKTEERSPENTIGLAESIIVSLSAEETRSLLHQVPSAYNTQINDTLLLSLVLAFAPPEGPTSLRIGLEGHGREEIVQGSDLSRTVGWFTSFFPINLRIENTINLGEALKSTKEQLRRIPSRGIGYGLLRYLSQNRETAKKLSSLAEPEVLFNYVGRFDQLSLQDSLLQLGHSPSISRSPRQQRSHLLEVNAAVFEEKLSVRWTYGTRIQKRETVESIAEGFVDALRRIIAHCLSPKSSGYTPSDFPEAGLNQSDLDGLIGKIS